MDTLTPYEVEEKVLDEIVGKYKGSPGVLLSTLEAVQEANPLKFLPQKPCYK